MKELKNVRPANHGPTMKTDPTLVIPTAELAELAAASATEYLSTLHVEDYALRMLIRFHVTMATSHVVDTAIAKSTLGITISDKAAS